MLWKFQKRLPLLKTIHFNAFPAIPLKKMDSLDFLLKFSSEASLVLLALTVAGLNIYYFTLTDPKEYSDKSLAAKFLSYHSDLNPRLHAKNSSSITAISREAGFISQAQAESLQNLSNTYLEELAPDEETNIWNEEYLINPTPDSVDNLLAKQIKIYETQPGETLRSIAKQNGISFQTLMWANKLASENIKPGWFLVIPPTDGIIHKATSNDTLPDLAKKYQADIDTIISYNGLANAEDIDGGQIIIIPNGKMPQPKVITPTPSRVADGKVNPQGTVKPKVVNNGTGHLFPWGYCTWYVASKVHVPWGGNAKNWLANAQAYGAIISKQAAVGSIVVTTDNSRYGHVALVESVTDEGFTISEMNYKKFGAVNTRFIPHGSKIVRGFILP